MDKDKLLSKLMLIGYDKNKRVGMTLHKTHPKIYESLIELTFDLNKTFKVNQTQRARYIFLKKYNGVIDNIKCGNTYKTFKPKKDDFILSDMNYVSVGWNKKFELINSINILSKEDTISILKKDNLYKNYLGKSKNRTLINENPSLYKSIYYHTSFMDSFNTNNNKFSMRILFLVKSNGDKIDIKCKKCKIHYTSFNYNLMYYVPICVSCFHKSNHKYPKIDWFKLNYPNNWEEIYEKFRIENAFKLSNSNKGYSKVSQMIFWMVYDKLSHDKKIKTYFKELNNEWFINDKKTFLFVDFKCGNKIIEFDGIYWHKDSQEKDKIRNDIYQKLNYELKIINEYDLTDVNELVNNLVNFIENEN